MIAAIEVIEGTRVRLRATFTPLPGSVAADPTNVRVLVRPPKGPTVTLVYLVDTFPTRISQGVYELMHIPNIPGRWWYSFIGSSPISGTNVRVEQQVIAKKAAVAA